jgi:hypothetical protein
MTESLICRCSRGTLYDVLQVSPWCEPDVIQAAYRALARTRHPDVNRDPDAEDQMRRLNVAYQVLSDPARRVRYDEELALEAGRPVPGRTVTRVADIPRPAAPVDDTWDPAMTVGTGPGSRTRRATTPSSRPAGFPAAGLDLRLDSPGLPRSVLYVSVVLVTAIAVLVIWLLVDAVVDRPVPGYRGVRAGEERSLGTSPRLPSAIESTAPAADPGLSRPQERWNR